MDISLVSAFVVGLFSTLHCLGMCGGIIGALTFSLPQEVRQHRWRLFPYISAYNLGRITSYTLAGALMGWLGDQLFTVISPDSGHLILQGIASSMMIGIGLYLAGWFPRFAYIEQL
ncbi:MAG: sulfite exporter TauE/SafE family protein, partial [Thiohalophilus sp.]